MKNDYHVITLIVGLPGSGKTTLANALMDEDTFLIDDPNRDKQIFDKAIESNKHKIIICDPLLINSNKEKIEGFLVNKFKNPEFEWIYFENDVEAAWANHLKRNEIEPRDISKNFIIALSKKYKIPSYVIPYKIYKGE